MAERHVVTMFMQHFGTPRDQEARQQLAAALPDGAEVKEPDDVGIFDVVVEADGFENALQIAWDAVAASGTDDHLMFLEHPDLPEHWRARAGQPPGQ
jgi:hypothetical protein